MGSPMAARLARHREGRADSNLRPVSASPRPSDTSFRSLPVRSRYAAALHAVWSSITFDYVARQKLSGTHMNYITAKQLACPPPEPSDRRAWQRDSTLADWIRPYVLELSYTSWRLKPYAVDRATTVRHSAGIRTPSLLRADLDAAFLHVYGLDRDEAEHVWTPSRRSQVRGTRLRRVPHQAPSPRGLRPYGRCNRQRRQGLEAARRSTAGEKVHVT